MPLSPTQRYDMMAQYWPMPDGKNKSALRAKIVEAGQCEKERPVQLTEHAVQAPQPNYAQRPRKREHGHDE